MSLAAAAAGAALRRGGHRKGRGGEAALVVVRCASSLVGPFGPNQFPIWASLAAVVGFISTL